MHYEVKVVSLGAFTEDDGSDTYLRLDPIDASSKRGDKELRKAVEALMDAISWLSERERLEIRIRMVSDPVADAPFAE